MPSRSSTTLKRSTISKRNAGYPKRVTNKALHREICASFGVTGHPHPSQLKPREELDLSGRDYVALRDLERLYLEMTAESHLWTTAQLVRHVAEIDNIWQAYFPEEKKAFDDRRTMRLLAEKESREAHAREVEARMEDTACEVEDMFAHLAQGTAAG